MFAFGPQVVSAGLGGGSLLLNANTTYWIIADPQDTFDGAWEDNSIGDIGADAGRSNNGPWNLHGAFPDHFVFRVQGRVANGVPDTGPSIALLGISLLGLAAYGRRVKGGEQRPDVLL